MASQVWLKEFWYCRSPSGRPKIHWDAGNHNYCIKNFLGEDPKPQSPCIVNHHQNWPQNTRTQMNMNNQINYSIPTYPCTQLVWLRVYGNILYPSVPQNLTPRFHEKLAAPECLNNQCMHSYVCLLTQETRTEGRYFIATVAGKVLFSLYTFHILWKPYL